jgi:hypothetical protein
VSLRVVAKKNAAQEREICQADDDTAKTRMQCPSTPPPSPRFDLTVSFQDESFQMSTSLFALYSPVFGDLPVYPKVIRVAEDIPRDSVLQFVKYCRCEPFEITSENVFGVCALADDWGVSGLREAAGKFISDPSRGRDLLIPALIDAIRRSAHTSDLETAVRDHFFEIRSDF